eukprot:3877721-Ditylum_brightwellii.AAC.1
MSMCADVDTTDKDLQLACDMRRINICGNTDVDHVNSFWDGVYRVIKTDNGSDAYQCHHGEQDMESTNINYHMIQTLCH